LREESLLVFCFDLRGILRFAQNDEQRTFSAACLAAGLSDYKLPPRLWSLCY
jgi:hypothetical protein